MPLTDLACGFCSKPLPLPRQPDRLAAFAGQVHQCRHCAAGYALVGDGANLRGSLATALHVAPQRLQLSVSPSVAEVHGQPLFLVSGWDPAEPLSTVRVAQILELHRATVQQHVREGRFPGARLSDPVGTGSRGYWSIPRSALHVYLYGKGKGLPESRLKVPP